LLDDIRLQHPKVALTIRLETRFSGASWFLAGTLDRDLNGAGEPQGGSQIPSTNVSPLFLKSPAANQTIGWDAGEEAAINDRV
jgi:hypothetical protein